MSFHAYISRQPKPVVFGLYGALGGLLGAILLGEPVWAFLKPPPPPPPEPRLVMTVSPAVEVYQGNENTITVQIVRDLFDQPVQLELVNGPPGVICEGLTIGRGETEGALTIAADSEAAIGVGVLELLAIASENGRDIRANARLSIDVVGRKLAKVDVMFVVDVTASMGFAIEGVRDGIIQFADGLSSNGIDFRVGLTAFRDQRIGEQAAVLDFDGAGFTADAKGFRRQVSKLRAEGGGDAPESSLDGLLLAVAQKFRSDADQVLILVTDAPPAIPDLRTQSIHEAVSNLAKKGLDQLHLVVNLEDKATYQQFRKVLPGQYFNLQAVSAGGAAFASLMPELSSVIAKASERPDQDAVLSERPPPAVIKSVQSSNSFDPRRIGQLVLAIACWTGCIAALISALLSGGQLHYLKASWPSPLSVAIGLACGMVAGLVGGAVGQGLFFLTPDAPIMESVFRVLGWSLLGCLSGLGLSVFIPNLKLWHGFVGGGVGGLIGAFGYLVASQFGPGGDITGRMLGALILGFCIGLVVAFVESSFRSAWIEVWRGPREMITVSLGPEPVRIGSDSRQSTVWVPGTEGIALKYRIREGQVVCFDSSTQVEGTAIDGDQRSVGRVKIVVRTGMDERTPPVLPPGPPPPPPPRVGPSTAKPRERVISAGVSQQVRPGGSPSREIKRGVPPPPPPPPPPRK